MNAYRQLSEAFVAIMAMLLAASGTAYAEYFVFETDYVRYVMDGNGASKSLQEKKGKRELLVGPPAPFAAVRRGGGPIPVTSVIRAGELFRAEFGQSGISADFRISSGPDRIVIELAKLNGSGVDEIRLFQLGVGGLANSGSLLTVTWDEQFAVSLMGLSERVESRFGGGMLLSSVYPEYGMVGEKVALIAVPRQQFTDAVRKIEEEFKLPSPMISGIWVKKSFDVRSSYLFTDLTEANVDETIHYAKRAGFKYILIYSHIWSSSLGSYPVNTSNFPRGEESLKAVIDKCHAAGIKVGMHMMTSFVSKNDALVKRPRHLASDATAVLAGDINERNGELFATSGMAHFPVISRDVRIDDEIIHYEMIGGPGSTRLVQCARGHAGTRAALHKAGAKIYHLAEFDGSYLADLKTSLKDEIADRISGLIDRCGFDMIYFDGGEVNCINGPCWYWAGQQQMSVWKRVKRDLLVQGSGVTHWTWHIFARGTSDDFAAVAPKQYLEYHKIADDWQFYTMSFMPAELGWWGFLANAPDHPATTPDEVEYYAVRMLALNSPVSLETSLSALKTNGRTDEMLRLLGEYERLRLSDAVPAPVREKLRSGEWHMTRKGGRPEFRPVTYDAKRVDRPRETLVKNAFSPQKLKFRLQAVPRLASVGDRSNISLLPAGSSFNLKPPAPNAVMPGALAGRVEAAKSTGGQTGRPLDFSAHRSLAVVLNVEGALPRHGDPPAVLNIQLESVGNTYRDHYIDLDFVGERTIVIPEPTTHRMLPEFRPSFTAYPFKSAMYGFNYQAVTAVNVRWMRHPATKPVKCTIYRIEALAETNSVLKNPEISVGTSRLVIPVTLKTGDYVEFWGEGHARVFDRNGTQLSTVEMPGSLAVATGENTIFLRSEGSSSAKLTTILLGEPLKF